MKEPQRKQLEQRLVEERARVLRAVRRLDAEARAGDADGDLTNYPLHPADEGTDAIEQEKELALLSAEGRLLVEIDDALRRLYDAPDTFGVCEACGEPIGAERLNLVPWARLCSRDQRAVENGTAG
jgi:RNA polymerase-binding transcription factor DksA